MYSELEVIFINFVLRLKWVTQKKKSFKFQWLLFFKKDPMKNYPKTLVIFSRNENGVYVNNYKEGDEVTLPPPTPVYIDTW